MVREGISTFRAVEIMQTNFATAFSGMQVKDVGDLFLHEDCIVLDDCVPQKVVTPRSILISGKELLGECIDPLPAIGPLTELPEIYSMMDSVSTDLLPVIECDRIIGIILHRQVSRALLRINSCLSYKLEENNAELDNYRVLVSCKDGELNDVKEFAEEAEQCFRTIFENIPVYLGVHNGFSEIILLSDYCKRTLNVTEKTDLSVMLAKKDRENLETSFIRVKQTGIPEQYQELKIINYDGYCGYVDLLTCPIKYCGRTVLLTIGIGATERKKILEEISNSKKLFHIAMRNQFLLIFTQDKQMRYSWIYCTHSKFDESSVIGKTDLDFMEHDDALQLMAIKKSVLETGVSADKEVCVRMYGKRFYARLIVEPHKDENNEIIGILCSAFDVTALVEKKLELEKSRENFIMLADSIAEICFALNRNLKIIYWGKTLARISGISPGQAIGRHIDEMYQTVPRRERLLQLIKQVIETNKCIRTTHKIGDLIYEFNMYPSATAVIVIAWKKTRMGCIQKNYAKYMERDLKHYAQILHNGAGQYLAALSMQCATLLEKLKSKQPVSADEIGNLYSLNTNASELVHEITQSMLLKAGVALPDNEIVRSVCNDVEQAFGIPIKYTVSEPCLPDGFLEREHIIRFIQEALTNSAKHSKTKEIFFTTVVNVKEYMYTISDCGCGFDSTSVMNGIGLKLMKFNAEELGGDLIIESKPGKTDVTLILPRF